MKTFVLTIPIVWMSMSSRKWNVLIFLNYMFQISNKLRFYIKSVLMFPTNSKVNLFLTRKRNDDVN